MADTPPTASAIPASPLGIDIPSPEPKTAAPVQQTNPPPDIPKGKTLTQAEYDELTEHSRNYKAIASDPKLVGMINDHYRGKLGAGSDNGKKPDASAPQMDSNLKAELDRLKQSNDTLHQRLAQQEVDMFREKNPDMDKYRDEMSTAIQRFPGISLTEAYQYAKSVKPQTNGPGKGVTTAPTTEVNTVDGGSKDDGNSFKAIEDKIADSKAIPRFEDAIDAAIRGAKTLSK